jgi:pimeloyl-ACP methyl ester carboxylesterase
MLKDFTRPTLVIWGENTRGFWSLPSTIAKCVPGARQIILKNVGHNGPVRDPAAFTTAVFEFLSVL